MFARARREAGAGDALVVVEVSSPSTAAEDLLDKKVQYVRAGIPAYLVVLSTPSKTSKRSASSDSTHTQPSTGLTDCIAKVFSSSNALCSARSASPT
ncbi:Uma2 family endonuclease [Nocardia sp. NPDC051052]|uniref:Uma2 family endonuclease n=1 Tax=Nocardia sp. NPDC051052 TaxID=3364322 RepID=UPI0037BDE12F